MVKESKNSFSTYTEASGGLSNRELKLGEWWIRHKIGLERALIIFLIIVCSVFWLYSLWGWGYYLVFGLQQDQRNAAIQTVEFFNFENTRYITAPVPLDVQRVSIYQSGPGTYDILGFATNQNMRFAAEATFVVVGPDGKEWRSTSVVLPGQTSVVGVFGLQSSSYPSASQLVIDGVNWTNADAHDIPNVESFMAARMQFDIADFAFTPGAPDSFPTIAFSLNNPSAYSYWSAPFYLELLRGGSTVGVLSFTEQMLRSGDTRSNTLRYFGDAAIIDSVRLYPNINIFDDSVYIAPGR